MPLNPTTDPAASGDEFPLLPLHPQEIRSSALQAASRLASHLPYPDNAADNALYLAARFETYIEYGSLTQDTTEKGDDLWVNPAVWAESITLTPEKIEAGREKLMAALRSVVADRTGRCDHCDKPQTGGAAGGGISPEHWCDDHRPNDSAFGSWDDDAPEAWEPKVGDRVTVHANIPSIADGTPATVDEVFAGIRRASLTIDRLTYDASDVGRKGWHVDFAEISPFTSDPEPTPAPAIELVDELAAALATANGENGPDYFEKWVPDAEVALTVFRERIGSMPQRIEASEVYREVYRTLFGNVGANQ